MDDNQLLGLQRAEFNRSETFSAHSNKLQIMIVVISAIAIFIDDASLVYVLTVCNLLIAMGWLYLSFQAKDSHSVAERARRAVVFSNALGIKLSGKSYTDLKMLFHVDEKDGKKYEDDNYFKSNQDYGNKKLAEIVEESAFWSKHLFKASAKRTWIYFAGTLIISILGLLLLPLFNIGNLDILISQVFCLILIWLVTGNLFTTAVIFTRTAHSIDDIEARLDNIASDKEPDQDVLVIVSDYNALVESTPAIPTDLYDKNRDRLNALWQERRRH